MIASNIANLRSALFLLAGLLGYACSHGGITMYTGTQFMSAHELRTIAGSVARKVLPVEAAETLPVLRRDPKEGLVVLILYYREVGPPDKRVVKLPDHAIYLNPFTGKVLRFWAIEPEELGIEVPLRPVGGAGVSAEMPKMEFVEKRQRFLDISPAVWEAFVSEASNYPANVLAMIRDYRSLFLQITKAEVAPYYVEAAPDFFRWLDQMGQTR